MAASKITIVINYRSPFCALAIDQIFELPRRFRVDVSWLIVKDVPRPSSLPITQENPRFAYNRQDCLRRARWLGLDWNPPSWRLGNVDVASQIGQWLLRTGSPMFEPFSIAVSRGYWSGGRNISEASVVIDIAREVGLTEAALAEWKQDLATVDRDLADNAAFCTDEGVLGVPYFSLNGDHFWGSDRLDALRRRLAELDLGPVHTARTEGLLFDGASMPIVPVSGREAGVAINRVYCVGRNYAAHAKEMGFDSSREAPFFFMKSHDAVVVSGGSVPYPPATSRYEYEMELAVILGDRVQDATPEVAAKSIFGYAASLDMTRRDLQLQMREAGRPWEIGKAFEKSAVIGAIKPAEDMPEPPNGLMDLRVNGELKQTAQISDMIWAVPEIIANLSTFFTLEPGDIILTGTPAGVGPVVVGDELIGTIEGIGSVTARIVDSERSAGEAGIAKAAA